MEEIDFMKAIRAYIEDTEVALDSEFGMARTLQEIVSEGDMPEIYREVLRKLEQLTGD